MRSKGLAWCVLSLVLPAVLLATPPTRNIYIVAGADGGHAPVGHAFYAGSVLWTNQLVKRGHNLNVTLLQGWPSNPGVFSNADAIVLYSDGGASHETGVISHELMRNGRWDRGMQVINRGVSFGAVHYAVEPSGSPQNWPNVGRCAEICGVPEFTRWLGGFYVPWYAIPPYGTMFNTSSHNETFAANLSFPDNPVNLAPKISYTGFNDEWYNTINFPRSVSPFLQCNNAPTVAGTHTVGWSCDRDDGARGFGWTGGHFTDLTPGTVDNSWMGSPDKTNNLNLLLNAIEWIGRVGEESHQQVVVPACSTWKYFVGTPAGNWNQAGADESAWASGTAPLGYDDWGQDWFGSQVAAGSSGNRPVTTWFRKTFNVSTLNNVTNFLVKVNADDGAVVYLNGTEIGRYNMPGGAVSSSTTASNTTEVNWNTVFDTVCPYADQAAFDAASQAQKDAWTAEWQAQKVAMTNCSTAEFQWGSLNGLSQLQQGANVLAVEVHQRDTSNPDMRLDVEAILIGNNSFIPGDTSTVTGVPSVTVNAATAIGTSTATLNGSLTSTGMLPTSVRFVWGSSDAGTNLSSWANTTTLGFQTIGNVSAGVASLTAGALYNYRVYASNSVGVAWSSVGLFTTKPTNFVAYNDVGWDSTQTSNRVTTYPIVGTSGSLVDYATGVGLDAQVSMTSSNGALWNYGLIGDAPLGSPAAQMLPTNILNSQFNYSFDSATLDVTGLNPSYLYTVVLYGNRGGDPISGDYTSRYTTVTLGGASSFQNNSTTGTVSQAAASSTMKTGVPHGEIFRFDQINPGGDGAFSLALTGVKPCLNSIMLQTPSVSGTNNPPPPSGAATNLIAMGASWQYFNTNSGPATNWSAKSFSDGSWLSGPAPLGYADPAIMTTLSYGGVDTNKWITYYFRKHFVVTNAASITGLVASFIADDGAVVYLNGSKVFTSTNMIEPVNNTSLTTGAEPEPYLATQFTIAPSGVTTGDNVMAIEVHQNTPGSSDVYFDLSLNAVSFATTNQVGGGQSGTNLPPAAPSDWMAYNDALWNGVNETYNGTYSTNSPSTGVNGPLMTTSGTVLSASVSFNTASAVSLASIVTNSIVLPPGTDAYNLFNGKVGLNNVSDWGSGFVSMTLSGLNTTKQYTVALFCSRLGDTSSYSDRWTVVTISSVDSFANNSSVGAVKLTTTTANDTTRLSAGLVQGLVARYDAIRPGTDGTVAFSLLGAGTNGQSHGYLNAFMVMESPVSSGAGDADADGMPDAWEQLYFGGTTATNGGLYQDADGDGVLNIHEFIAGTSPTSGSSGPMLDHTILTNNMVKFDLMTATGRLYTIDFRSNLTSSSWQNYTSFLGNGSTMGITNTRLDPRLYYRFRVRMENP